MASSYRLCLLLEQEMASSMVCCEHLGETGSLGDTGRRRERLSAQQQAQNVLFWGSKNMGSEVAEEKLLSRLGVLSCSELN